MTLRSGEIETGCEKSFPVQRWLGVNDKHAVLRGMTLLPGVEFDDQLYYFGTKSSSYISKSAQLANVG